MKKTSRMRNLYNNRVFWMVISLLASLAIWVYITSVDSDEYKQTFRGVRVELVGEDVLRESKQTYWFISVFRTNRCWKNGTY